MPRLPLEASGKPSDLLDGRNGERKAPGKESISASNDRQLSSSDSRHRRRYYYCRYRVWLFVGRVSIRASSIIVTASFIHVDKHERFNFKLGINQANELPHYRYGWR